MSPKPLTAQGRSDTLQEMNELIAYRLQVEEHLPSRLQVVAIRESWPATLLARLGA